MTEEQAFAPSTPSRAARRAGAASPFPFPTHLVHLLPTSAFPNFAPPSAKRKQARRQLRWHHLPCSSVRALEQATDRWRFSPCCGSVSPRWWKEHLPQVRDDAVEDKAFSQNLS
ncbi:unnamed protein product [Urochloa humidicola]